MYSIVLDSIKQHKIIDRYNNCNKNDKPCYEIHKIISLQIHYSLNSKRNQQIEVILRSNLLENRESNITTQLASIFKAFEDCRLVQQIREEIEKVKQINVLSKVVTA